ncbi:HAMP domain-containing protein [Herbaspirillum sp. GCM10030257]|uniref:HAMP domain-containing protein n=1 Tax=Herbaspirillum sp. GCM10030257 TaxID=3273393 RepID=UPI003620594F
MLAVGVITFALGAFIAIYITRIITAPLERTAAIADTIASGDLTTQIDVAGKDEAARLAHSLKVMQVNLVSAVSNIKQSTETMAVAARKIASGNADLSSRTKSQANSLEESA